jgi:hypothetical protein
VHDLASSQLEIDLRTGFEKSSKLENKSRLKLASSQLFSKFAT